MNSRNGITNRSGRRALGVALAVAVCAWFAQPVIAAQTSVCTVVKLDLGQKAALEREVEELKGQRPLIAEQLHAAMADKDFRENAPLDAARDAQAHLEARIRTIEDQLRHAVIIDADQKGGLANVGSTVRVLNLKSDREQTFHLVSPNEVDPSTGKISIESPVGRAVIHHGTGDEVTVLAPAGEIELRLLEVIG